MEPQETSIQGAIEAQTNALPSMERYAELPSQKKENQPCHSCGDTVRTSGNSYSLPNYVYALGRIDPRFPNISIEKEYAQVAGRSDTGGLTDRQALYKILQQHRYLVRQLCWVFSIQGLETYLLHPRDPVDFNLLVEALRRDPSPTDMDVVIGVRGPIAPPEMCNGLMIPIVAFDPLYSFSRDDLLKSIPRPDKITEEQFRSSTEEVLDRIMQIADNAGATDEHRALNYLVVRYPAIYAQTFEGHQRNESLTAIEVRPSSLSSARKIVDVIFSYTNRATDVMSKFLVRVDVTEEFPFLVTKLSPYFDR